MPERKKGYEEALLSQRVDGLAQALRTSSGEKIDLEALNSDLKALKKRVDELEKKGAAQASAGRGPGSDLTTEMGVASSSTGT